MYEGAGHAFSLPNMPTTVNTLTHPITKTEMTLGGEPEHTAAAARDAWAQTLKFLGEALGK